jgi:hypothetical protein
LRSNFVPGKGKRPTIALITPSIWEMSAKNSHAAFPYVVARIYRADQQRDIGVRPSLKMSVWY